jgi:hypothetical protein
MGRSQSDDEGGQDRLTKALKEVGAWVLIALGVWVFFHDSSLMPNFIRSESVIPGGFSGSVNRALADDHAGSADNPILVEEGEQVQLRDFDIREGWVVRANGARTSVEKVRIENTGDRTRRLSFHVNFLDDAGDLLASITCLPEGPLQPGQGGSADCLSDYHPDQELEWTQITVAD